MPTYLSRVYYAGNGSADQFAVTFPYLVKDHVKVYVGGVDTAYTWINSGLIELAEAPALNVSVAVQRETPRATRLVDFADGSVLSENDLDVSALQTLYIVQELEDELKYILSQLNNIISSGGGVPTPLNPADNNKVLTATNGASAWSNALTVSSVATATLSVSGTSSFVGNVSGSGNLSVGGQLSGDTLVIGSDAIFGDEADIVGNASVGNTLTIRATVDTDWNKLRFVKHEDGDRTVEYASVTSPEFYFQQELDNRTLSLWVRTAEATFTPLWSVDNKGTGNAARFRFFIDPLPATDNARDIGSASLRFKDLYLSGTINVGGGSNPEVNVITSARFDTVTGKLQFKTTPVKVLTSGSESAWTDMAADYYNLIGT
jgi:hypothetical protein